VPQGYFSSIGNKNIDSEHDIRSLLNSKSKGGIHSITSGLYSTNIAIESWLMPDFGGTVVEKEGQFSLRVGEVHEAAPIVFTVSLLNKGRVETHTIQTGYHNGSRYVGAIYPKTESSGIFNTQPSDLNRNHRELIHVVATFYGSKMQIYVNGTLMAHKSLFNEDYVLNISENNIYIGGKGGGFRGVLESLHIAANFRQQMVEPTVPLRGDDTLLLYRFEEPITVFDDVFQLTGSASAGATTINIGTTAAAKLATLLKGTSVTSGTVDFTESPFSSGNYKVIQSSGSGITKHDVAHVPYNLLLRPGGYDHTTKKPNGSPPERVRLKSINTSTGVLTIASIHLDFDTANNGNRGLLHAHTTDSRLVVVGADLLIDSGTGKPYQPPHYSSKAIDRTGQMVIDESVYEQHGFVYSSRMALTTIDTDNPYAASWPTAVSTDFSIGHSGRHTHNHVQGHHYLRRFPKANDEILDTKSDGSADLIKAFYDVPFDGIKEQLSINSKVNMYNNLGNYTVIDFVNSSSVGSVYSNYELTSSPGSGVQEIIAIGGSGFNYTPFLLKSPVISPDATPNEETRTHHLRPSKESRVALLHMPTLASSYNLAPYVEIHYNAIDLTGASMNNNNATVPLLMVEKTIPSGTTQLAEGVYLYETIKSALNSGSLTLYAPGGCLMIDSGENPNARDLLSVHSLSSDNSEGYDADTLLDESNTPPNLTPYVGDTLVNTPPSIITDSTSKTSQHDSSFHQLMFETVKTKKDLSDYSDYRVRDVVTTNSSAEPDTIITSSSSPVFETFDIIDNVSISNNNADTMLIVQPAQRSRFYQLKNVKSGLNTLDSANMVSLHYLLSRARLRSIDENKADDGTSHTQIQAIGLQNSLAGRNVSFTGSGSNDSHIVKEIEPNAPVVSVTLGGPGQGAVDTKPTFLESEFSREAYSTRRDYVVTATKYDASNKRLYVNPINNNSSDMKSWGTFGFPKVGKIYFEDGSHAKYDSKASTYFQFSTATLGSNDFASGAREHTEIYQLLQSKGHLSGVTSSTSGNQILTVTVSSEPDFGEESQIDDGTTVNDRMFHSLNDVSQDYQLGTQYASTRALVEIPFFANQFFDNESVGTFIDGDNSFKIHLDATNTAHTYNPSPVGRRPKGVGQTDREALSAYAHAIENNTYISSAKVLSYNGTTTITVDDANIFPDADNLGTDFRNIGGSGQVLRNRRAFTKSGEWVVYTDVDYDANTLTVSNGDYFSSINFFNELENSMGDFRLYVGQSLPTELIEPIGSDKSTPSADYENRSEYYHDQASMMTQGGNVDYGLRQYVSAIEIKAGPESNPHADRVTTKRAKGKIEAIHPVGASGVNTLILSLSDNDFLLFPSLGNRSIDDFTLGTGEMFYEATIDYNGTDYKFHYYGHLEEVKNYDTTNAAAVSSNIPKNSIVLVYYTTGSYPSASVVSGLDWFDFIGSEVILTGKKRRIFFDDYVNNANDGINYYASEKNPLVAELTANVKFNSNLTYASDDSTRTITVNNGTTSKSLNDYFDMNFKEGDLLFYKLADGSGEEEIGYIGVVDTVLGGTSISLKAAIPNWPSFSAGNTLIGVAVNDFDDFDATLNSSWLNPYCNGGLRQGDTVWANMSYSNPHAMEGLFSKSRGVYNEGLVWKGFNGGEGALHATNPRESIPMENFLIGDTCIETARNLAQHINKTVEENYKSLGLTAANAPTVAFVDPYLSSENHARVLLYDAEHDREYIAFQDIHMQVQSSAETTKIGWDRNVVEGTNTASTDLVKRLPEINGAAAYAYTTQIDVANGYPSQNKFIRSTQQSKFIESAYAHDLANKQTDDLIYSTLYDDTVRENNFSRIYGKAHGHHVHVGLSITGNADGYAYSYSTPLRNNEATASWKLANSYHVLGRKKTSGFLDGLMKNIGDTLREKGTLLDTPDGTRVIPAFLCLKGIRTETLELSDARMKLLPQWTEMDFVRRLSISTGDIAESENVVNVESAVYEIVRKINQYGALQARLSNGASAHDPSPFWDTEKAFANQDRGSHMGYLRAHIGRAVEDREGNQGHTIVIHSTVPGATGRNFCVWLDNSTSQTTYNPQFLVGHGGRWRNFWALPEEKQGENMHPAPMPLDKNGRPFSPITTLRQYIQPNESGESVLSVADFGAPKNTDLLALTDMLSGKNHNSVNPDSFDLEASSVIVDGLRTGTTAIGRVNFGGLVATGVPGFSPKAGLYGFGKRGDSTYANRYGITDTTTNDYTTHISTSSLDEENIGTQDIYGLQLKDHKNNTYGVRYVYSKLGKSFVNENSTLPDTFNNEAKIHFDDSSTEEGGFTIGKHMRGTGDATGRLSSSLTASDWRGNRWNAMPSPNLGVKLTLAVSGNNVTVTYGEVPYTSSDFTHPDKLGYLGFPKENGVFQTTKVVSGSTEGDVTSYEYRVGDTFYNCTNKPAAGNYIVSPTLNWTTLVTDELMAAATAFAINLPFNSDNDVTNHIPFDCTLMYAADGKTFGEHGVSKDAIRVVPSKHLSSVFSASTHKDFGIQAAHLEFGEITKAELDTSGNWAFGTSRAPTNTQIDTGRSIDCGYIPNTILRIKTKFCGPNSNTVTPIIVGSNNKPINTSQWKKNLMGEDYLDVSGDKILPKIDNPIVRIDTSATTGWGSDRFRISNDMYHFLKPATDYTSSDAVAGHIKPFGERKNIYINKETYVTAEAYVGDNSTYALNRTFTWEARSEVNWPAAEADAFLHLRLSQDFDGIRSIGSVMSEPIVYFKGGKSSPDHSVPLFFGGGFSGVVLDVNDGSMNDYSDFYTHPYSNGPTGTAGIQNANEISTSFAMLDCNAIFSFFPGAALCNQHRGSPLPPMFNKQNVLSTDLDRGGTLCDSNGVVKAKPVPLVLRFPHPTARYEDHKNDVDNKTTYLVFGPGQAFPFHNERTTSNGETSSPTEPHPGRVVTTGNGWNKVPYNDDRFHNQINNTDTGNSWKAYRPKKKSAYLADAAYHWRCVINWETPAGYPLGRTYRQYPSHGRNYGQMIDSNTTYDNRTQPLGYTPFIGYGIATAADTVFHMDGGFHPGGHWMDEIITFNPPKQTTEKISVSGYSEINPTAFRVAATMVTAHIDWTQATNLATTNVDTEYIVVDGTRCQNGEELASIISSAINSFPGKGALKSIGGTHHPSMGTSNRQDRYGWVDVDNASGTVNTGSTMGDYWIESAETTDQDKLNNLPASGWLRASTTTSPAYACYYMKQVIPGSGSNFKARFYLAPNKMTGTTATRGFLHDNGAVTPATNDKLWVWSKTGVIRFNNENASARDHMTQVHFSGVVDAIDRTKPIGAVGWHGERYSYLNSLRVGTEGYAAGLGAYHPFLNFTPYGTASTVMNVYGSLPLIAPLPDSPESSAIINDGETTVATRKSYISAPYTSNTFTTASSFRDYGYTDAKHATQRSVKPPNHVFSYANADTTSVMEDSLHHPQGVYSSAFLVVSYESELSMVAKHDRDGVDSFGDWLYAKHGTSADISDGGTTKWDTRFHGQDRFVAPANAGPNVEGLIVSDMALPTGTVGANWIDSLFPPASGDFKQLHSAVSNDLSLRNAVPGLNVTGDLLYDLDHSVGSLNLEASGVERNVSEDFHTGAYYSQGMGVVGTNLWMSDINGYQTYQNSSAKNFTVENVVWKRMDGGNLSLPAINARGMGAVPFITRVKNSAAHLTGEKIYGNVRFSFETTNSVMMPTIEAQEMNQPGLPNHRLSNALQIPNEETQFQDVTVVDDSGKEHTIEGGSPFGTVIRCFDVKRGKPSLANSGDTPNLAVRLPNPDSIPGNIVVRSGFDPIQAYQTETFGSGGTQHPGKGSTRLGELFERTTNYNTNNHPVYEEYGWEHFDNESGESKIGGFNTNSLDSAYELHDRMLLFHVCKVGVGHTHRYPTAYAHAVTNTAGGGVVNQALTVSSFSSGTLTASATIDTTIFSADFGTKEEDDNRRYIRVYNASGESGLASYTGISGTTFTTVKGDANFVSLVAKTDTLTIVPSYPIPAGSARFYAANRLRDHAEVSGNSPDMTHTKYVDGSETPYQRYSKPIMTPMAYPRMGHHYVNATQPMLPGHWAHPAYQSLYKKHRFEQNFKTQRRDSKTLKDAVIASAQEVPVKADLSIGDSINPVEPEIAFGSLNAAPSPPSDLHGGAFTLMFETSVKWDGYGVLASLGNAGVINKAGGHSIVLAAAANYTLANHFPDPSEVGAYQIVIQPNMFRGQIGGVVEAVNSVTGVEEGAYVFTGQQVNTVIGIKKDESEFGGLVLILAKATQFDCRGCEVFVNELMLDISPDFGSQFTKIPPLLLYNPYGVNLNETPSFTRRNFPYSPMMVKSTPSHTLNIPWWSILFGNIHSSTELIENTSNYMGLSQYAPHNYEVFAKSTYGSVGHILGLQGHNTKYPNIYSSVLENTSPIAKCTITSKGSGGVFTVDNGSAFPANPQFGQEIYFTAANGKVYSTTYTRSGYAASEINLRNTFTVANGSQFYSNMVGNETVYLSSNYNSYKSFDYSNYPQTSNYAKTINTLSSGSRDTNTLHPPDAFLCLWNHNLGRPMTYFSDTRSAWSSQPVNQARYNAMPEHYETIHYHSANYQMSFGPFSFMMKAQKPSNGVGSLYAADGDLDTYDVSSGIYGNALYGGYWPCGSRGGPQASCLDSYTQSSVSWSLPGFASDVTMNWKDEGWNSSTNAYTRTTGITTAIDNDTVRRNFGYRVGLKQAYNRPAWGIIPARGALEKEKSGVTAYNTTSYDSGPIVQIETHGNLSSKYTGILGRLSNFTGMLNSDVQGEQVRYAQGTRMTRPFGVPVRTLSNKSTVERDWWGDVEGLEITDLALASKHYLVDWWGNDRGEDVRKSPVRGFGIRPAWDCGNAYKEGTNTPFDRIWNSGSPLFNVKNILNSSGQVSITNSKTIPRYGGVVNSANNNSSSTLVDVFAPFHSLRIGDMGNGRGVRYPTFFNQCIYTDVSQAVVNTGLVLSKHTSEPLFSEGLLRPRNDALQADEMKRGISNSMNIAEDGLLKSEATVSSRTETIDGSSKHLDAISRTSPRIGIDAPLFDTAEENFVALNSEAHSLHTDRNVGQRVVLQNAFQRNSKSTTTDFVTPSAFTRQSAGSLQGSILRFSHTSVFRSYGGSYILEAKNYASVVDDSGWGRNSISSPSKSSNPYQNSVKVNNNRANNETDNSVRFLVRPIRVLDNQHVELYRMNDQLHSSSPQEVDTEKSYYSATSGNKYGLFNYEVDTPSTASFYVGGTAGANANGPYYPVVLFDDASFTNTRSTGPTIPTSESTNFTSNVKQTVARLIVTENTLQHHRSDSVRNGDFTVQPRFSQSLHPKGHKGDVTFNTDDHTGDAT
tara:strand:+ start:2993 stop:18955 length:15963 start_codon:yes stop_codon:yes gene_type:complete